MSSPFHFHRFFGLVSERQMVHRLFAVAMIAAVLAMSAAPFSVIAEDGDVPTAESGAGVDGDTGAPGTDGSAGHGRDERGARDGDDGRDGGAGESGEDGSGSENGTGGTAPSDDATSGGDGSGTDFTTDGEDGTPANNTGNQTGGGDTDTTITTGDATATTDVTTTGNVNTTDTEATDEPLGADAGTGDGNTGADGGAGANGSEADGGGSASDDAPEAGDESDAYTRDDRRDTKTLDKRPRDYATTTLLEITIEQENDITVVNENETAATTGQNSASGGGAVTVTTGTSTAFANILNAVNVNLVNSSGLMLFFNSLFGSLGTLDLRTALSGEDVFIGNGVFGEADPSLGTCTFTGCAGDVSTRIYASSTARIINDVIVRSIAGGNTATTSGELARIESGDARAAANVINVVNTNIVNSNYLLLALNAFGDWAGNIVFPNGDFFKQLFGGGEDGDEILDGEGGRAAGALHASTTIASTNSAGVGNDLGVNAETGLNVATSIGGSAEIGTGSSAALGQVMNRLNQNIIGGNSMLVLLQIHGDWAGDLFNVPEGILWEKTPGGVAIWNDPDYHGSGAVAPSGDGSGSPGSGEAGSEVGGLEAIEGAFVPLSELTTSAGDGGERGDRETRRAARERVPEGRRGTTTTEIIHQNIAEIVNNVKVLALTGDNRAHSSGGDALITSGDAFAAANILNIANTNVVGANWVLALVNIFGNWSGNFSFGEPDLWIGTTVDAPRNPLEAGDELTYHFTVANHGDARASNVWLSASALGDLVAFDRSLTDSVGDAHLYLGALAPGEVRELSLAGRLDTPLPFGRHTIDHTFAIRGYESETNRADNTEKLTLLAFGGEPPVAGGGSGTGGDSGSGGMGGGSTDSGSGSGGNGSGGGSGTNTGGSSASGSSTGNSGSGSGADTTGGSSGTTGGGGSGGVYYTPPANLTIEKRNSATAAVPADSSVNYTVIIRNDGSGEAYHAVLLDTLTDKDGTIIHEERWSLETIYPAEEVTVTYTVEFSRSTAPGTYTNSAYVRAYDGHPSLDPFYGSAADSPTVTSTVTIAAALGASSSSGSGAGGTPPTGATVNTSSTQNTARENATITHQNTTSTAAAAASGSATTTVATVPSFALEASTVAQPLTTFPDSLAAAPRVAPVVDDFDNFPASGLTVSETFESGDVHAVLPDVDSSLTAFAADTEGTTTPFSGLRNAAAALLAGFPISLRVAVPILLIVFVSVIIFFLRRTRAAG